MNYHKMLVDISLVLLLFLVAFRNIYCLCGPKSEPLASGQSGTGDENFTGECYNNETKLLLVQVVFRHGDRTPLFTWPKDPHNPKTSNNSIAQTFQRRGLLTKRGILQAHELGIFLAQRYKHFIENLWIPEDILAKSSDVERTVMTAQTVLTGLFPPYHCPKGQPGGCEGRWSKDIKWQPIPVYPIPKKYDNKINFYGIYHHCPAYEQELERVVASECIQQYIALYQNAFDEIKEHTGLESVSIRNVGLIYDTLYIQSLYELPLPNWTKPYYPAPLQELEEFGTQILSSNKEMMRFNGGPLLQEVINNMKQAAGYSSGTVKQTGKKGDERQKKLFLYSGHDTTVAAFLATLDLLYQHQPAYTSAVIVELHEPIREKGCGGSSLGRNEPFVKVFYRNATKGALREMIIGRCGNPCHLDKLEETSKDLFLSNWKQTCDGTDTLVGWIIHIFGKLVLKLFKMMVNLTYYFWKTDHGCDA